MDEGQLLLLWPGEVRRKREGDFGQIGPALLADTNNSDQSIKEISSTSYLVLRTRKHITTIRGFNSTNVSFLKILT